MKNNSFIYRLGLTSILFTPLSQAEVMEPVIIIENIQKVFPGSYLSPAYAIRSTDSALLRIEKDNVINTGVIGSELIAVLPSSFNSFAALTSYGEVFTNSGNLNSPATISDVIDLQVFQGGFAALTSNGNIVTWNDQVPPYQCQSHLKNVKKIITSPQGYGAVALHRDGTLSVWSYDICDGFYIKDINVVDVAVGVYGFTVLDTERTATLYPYNLQFVISKIKNIDRVVSGHNYGLSINHEGINCDGGFFHADGNGALSVATAFGTGMMMLQMSDGSISHAHCHGSTVSEQSQTTLQSLSNIKSITSNYSGFAAIDSSGHVFTWGGYSNEYDDSQLDKSRHNVASVTPMFNSFAALKHDGTVIAWGDHMNIDDGSHRKLSNIVGIYPSSSQFLALSISGVLYSFD